MEAIKTPLSAAFTMLWSKASGSSSAKAFLPGEDTALTATMDSKFPPGVEKCELRIEGMTCGACVEVRSKEFQSRLTKGRSTTFQAIESQMRNQPGIQSIKVALLAERAVIEYDPEKWSTEKLVNVSSFILPSGVSLPIAKMSAAWPTPPLNRKSRTLVLAQRISHQRVPTQSASKSTA